MRISPFLLLLGAAAVAHAQSTTPPPADGHWSKQQLATHFWAEGACAADVNKDGKADVISGPYWYEGPDFKKTHAIYPATASFKQKDTGETIPGFEGYLSGVNKYSDNFLSYAFDCNADGWMDYIVIGFPGKETCWYANPQGKDEPWAKHVMLDVTDNESPMLADITGDGKPELLCMSGGFIGYAEADWKNPTAKWAWHPVSEKGAYQRFTHGIGCGDINGDGRTDLLETRGWWEQPADRSTSPWKLHEAVFALKGGAQMYGYDVNGDGKTDVITSLSAHEYGVVWWEQTDDGGVPGWRRHLLTGTMAEPGELGVIFSQPHAIDLADVNGDGLKDIVTGKRFWAHGPTGDPEPNAPAVVWWLELQRANGQAKYVPHLVDADSGIGCQVMATDVSGDGKPDIVVGNKRGVFVHTQK